MDNLLSKVDERGLVGLQSRPHSSVNRRSETHEFVGNEHTQSERCPVRESVRRGGVPSQIDPAVVMEMLTAI